MTEQTKNRKPVRIGIAGLTHDHVFGILRRPDLGDIEVVGIYEQNRALAEKYTERIHFPMERVYEDLQEMLEATQPEAVTAFGSIYEHKMVVEACAPRGVHVMVEKPLAVSLGHAQEMVRLAQQYGIHLMTNYETTWYASMYAAYDQVVNEGKMGEIRKVVVHDGHRGPKEIGCTDEFLAWLTDPVLNGGGAVIDFGCYGANLITWLMGGAQPETVTAVTQTLKPEVYPKVDDEATILLTYPHAQGIIQGSWNWPVSRKDMEIYGQKGQLLAVDGKTMRIRMGDRSPEETVNLTAANGPLLDGFAYLAALTRGEITMKPGDLSSLENNLTVVKILDAARESARTGMKITL